VYAQPLNEYLFKISYVKIRYKVHVENDVYKLFQLAATPSEVMKPFTPFNLSVNRDLKINLKIYGKIA